MSNVSDFISSGGGGAGLKPFQDLGTVTGTVDLDVGTYGSFRVVQGAGDITFTVSGTSADTAGNVELWFYPDFDWSVDLSAFELVDNGYVNEIGELTGFSSLVAEFDPNVGNFVRSFAFNNDGTKLFFIDQGNGAEAIYEFSLSTPYEIATASFTTDFDLSVQTTTPSGLAFSNTGEVLFISDKTADRIFQYNLTTGFDLTTMSYSGVERGVSSTTDLTDVSFNNDGTKAFVSNSDPGNQTIDTWSLSPAYDLSSRVDDNVTLSLESADLNIESFTFNNDGTKIFIPVLGKDSISQYNLTTAFDLSTGAFEKNIPYPSGVSFANKIIFGTDTKSFILTGNVLYEYPPTYDFGPYFLYAIQHLSTTTYLRTISPDYTIREAP